MDYYGTAVNLQRSKMILTCTPYRQDRNLGRAYNEAFEKMNEEDWLIITDYDVLLLLPDQISHIHEYIYQFTGADMFVCWSNRTYHSNAQLYGGPVPTPEMVSKDDYIVNHIKTAKYCYKDLYKVTEVKQNVSGFLMAIPKRTWNEIKFTEDLKCLGVDTLFSQRMLNAGKKILRMDGIFVFHTYRIDKDIRDKAHLL